MKDYRAVVDTEMAFNTAVSRATADGFSPLWETFRVDRGGILVVVLERDVPLDPNARTVLDLAAEYVRSNRNGASPPHTKTPTDLDYAIARELFEIFTAATS